MTLYQFRDLTEVEQANAVWAGVFLDSRAEGEYKVNLYAVDGFYVEVYYSRERNKIDRLRPFKTTNNLEPYLVGTTLDDVNG